MQYPGFIGRQLYSHGLHLSDPSRPQTCSWVTFPAKRARTKSKAIKKVRQGPSMMLREESPFCKVQQPVRVCSAVTCVSPKKRREPSVLPAVSVVNTLAERQGPQALLVCFADGILFCLSLFLGFLALPLSSCFSCLVTGKDGTHAFTHRNYYSTNSQPLSVF